MKSIRLIAVLNLVAVVVASVAIAASSTPLARRAVPDGEHDVFDPAAYAALRYRSVGPYRGGRVTAVEGFEGKPFTFLFGATGGGVWRTDNAGHTWRNITDGFLQAGPIGAIEVASADPNVIYVGTGSACLRGNVSIGVGAYRSSDMGKTWDFIGLSEAGQIGRIVTHPADADRVYAAATGNPFGANEERGVFRSVNGGREWERVLHISDEVGAVDLAMSPGNARVLFAAMWRGERKPWTMVSGSEDSGLFRTTDGGDSWERVEGGFPQGLVGKIGVTVSPADSDRVWAIVEAPEGRGGIYRSDDGGDTWRQINTQGNLVGRPWYYMHIEADPANANVVWVLNSGMYRSIDGGISFESMAMPHSDHHDLWIDPANTDVVLVGNDGGATLSVDGGASWSPQFNQPTGEFYSVTVDDRFPYRLYGPQQDNSSISVPSAATYSGISMQHWLSVGGCETGPIAIKKDDPDIYYAGCFGGRLSRYNRRTEQFRQIRMYPEENGGMPESKLRYRVQWNAPITTSEHDPAVLYHGSQYVHRSVNEGQSWEVISPDLTGNHTEMFGPAGGPITVDITGVEVYSALLAIEEDRFDSGVIWAGSNDGVVSVTRDAGSTWQTVTPAGLPQLSTVNRIEPSPHRAGKAYVTAYRYRVDDWQPYVFRTTDFGATWSRVADGSNGIPGDWPVRVVREDPGREGLLYAGTEFGLFVSFDDGDNWQSLQLNLPRTPVTDLRVHHDDLVVATQGRGMWILDDVTPLQQLSDESARAVTWLFAPRPAYRTSATTSTRDYGRDHVYGAMMPRGWLGENPPVGAVFYYRLQEPTEVTLEILAPDGSVARRFAAGDRRNAPDTTPGMHRLVWDLTYAGPDFGGRFAPSGPRAVPGTYSVRMTVGDESQTRSFEVRKDPRLVAVTVEDLQAQFNFLQRTVADINSLQATRNAIGAAHEQLDTIEPRLSDAGGREEILESVRDIKQQLTAIDNELVQSAGGGWANEAKLQRNLSWVATAASSQRGERTDARPTDQLVERLSDLEAMLEQQQQAFAMLVADELADLNGALLEMDLAAVVIEAR